MAKVISLQASVCPHGGGTCSGPGGVPGRHTLSPPGPDPPGNQTPPGPDPPGPDRQKPPRDQTPPGAADSGIRSMSGWYASYWNAFLFFLISLKFFSFSGRSCKIPIHLTYRTRHVFQSHPGFSQINGKPPRMPYLYHIYPYATMYTSEF